MKVILVCEEKGKKRGNIHIRTDTRRVFSTEGGGEENATKSPSVLWEISQVLLDVFVRV